MSIDEEYVKNAINHDGNSFMEYVSHLRACRTELKNNFGKKAGLKTINPIGVSEFFKKEIIPDLHREKYVLIILAICDIIKKDSAIEYNAIIDIINNKTKNDLVKQTDFIISDFLASIFLYIVTETKNKGSEYNINNITEEYLSSFKDRVNKINLIDNEEKEAPKKLKNVLQDVVIDSKQDFSIKQSVRENKITHDIITRNNVTVDIESLHQNYDKLYYINKLSHFIRIDFLKYLNTDNSDFDDIFEKYSDLFSIISKLEHNKQVITPDNLLQELFNILTSKTNSNHILKVVGPTGAEKNAIIQLLFIKLYRHIIKNDVDNILPLMIDLYYLENAIYTSEKTFDEQIIKYINDIISDYKNQCKQYPEMQRIIFVSGVRNYQWGVSSIDYFLQKELAVLENTQFVISVDIDLIMNKPRIRRSIPIAPVSFTYILNIESVDLSDEEKSKHFLSRFEKITNDDMQHLYQKLIKMHFYSIDAHQLKMLKNMIFDKLDDQTFNISELYEAYCLDFLRGNQKLMEEAAQAAFEFAYTDIDFNDIESYTKPYWKLVRSHSTFIDYFISRYYLNKLREFNNSSSLSDFEMILPKTVTRFITPQLNSSFADEERMINLCKSKYYDMGIRGQSEMTYWLGRIRSSNLTNEATELLKTYYGNLREKIKLSENKSNSTLQEKTNDLFILRGITVSLIYRRVPKISDAYIHSMLENDLASSINRGFHLEYYGDKEYLPIYNTLDYKDALEVGDKTLRQLVKAVDADLSHSEYLPSFELSLFTICSILQARIENPKIKVKFNIEPFVIKTIDMLEKYLKTGRCVDEKIEIYFESMLSDFKEYFDKFNMKRQFMSIRLYNKYSKATNVKRAGWVIHNIQNPENIVEHIYNCWLMCFFILPDQIEHEETYSKQRVLDMILIHDLGECITGDIAKTIKLENPSYAKEEDSVMKMLFLKGTYPMMPNFTHQYNLWTEWQEQKTFNARLAKDIDVIQAIYQLCYYISDYHANFTEEKLANWINERNELRTDMGKRIFKDLIEFNDEFSYIDEPVRYFV